MAVLKSGYPNLTWVILLVTTFSGYAGSNHRSDPWFGVDKVYHFCGGAVIGGGTTAIAEHNGWSKGDARYLAFGVTLSLGRPKRPMTSRSRRPAGPGRTWSEPPPEPSPAT